MRLKKGSFPVQQNYLSDLVALILSAINHSMMLICYVKIRYNRFKYYKCVMEFSGDTAILCI